MRRMIPKLLRHTASKDAEMQGRCVSEQMEPNRFCSSKPSQILCSCPWNLLLYRHLVHKQPNHHDVGRSMVPLAV